MHLRNLLRTTSFRLSCYYALLFAGSVLILFAVVYLVGAKNLTKQLNKDILGEVESLSDQFDKYGPDAVARAIGDKLNEPTERNNFYLLQDAGRHALAGNMQPMAPTTGWFDFPVPPQFDRRGEGDPIRGYGVLLPRGYLMVVGQDTHHLVEMKELTRRAFGWGVAVTVVLAIVGGAAFSRGSLNRLDLIHRISREIIDGSLHRRLPTRGTGDEVDRLSEDVNMMLDRIQSLMGGLQQVSTDIAHELRSPLGRMRQRLESARGSAGSLAECQAAFDRAIEDIDAIQRTFSALLRIAQIESGSRRYGFSEFDLSTVVETVADAYAAVAEEKRQTLSTFIESRLAVYGDRELVMQMVANVIENAIRHCPAGSTIDVTAKHTSGTKIVEVADDGPGIPVDFRAKVFNRFYRLDLSRSTPGSGLGLSLVAAVVKLHNASITLSDNGPGLRVFISLPDGGIARPQARIGPAI